MSDNILYYGENLDILRRYIGDETVDLVYLDPPFNSNQDYNVLFAEKNGTRSVAQVKAFEDTWHWDIPAAEAYEHVVEGGGKVAQAMIAFRWLLGDNDMMAYLANMAPRLVELRRVLKPTGSLYLHCDPTASHYLKTLLDAIFGGRNFTNEVIWQKIRASKGQTKGFGRVHDVILVYACSWDEMVFHRQYGPLSEERLRTHYANVEPESGRRYMLDNFTQAGAGPSRRFGDRELAPPSGKHWIWTQDRIDESLAEGRIVFTSRGMPRVKRYLDESRGNPVEDIWSDIPPVNSMASERLHYPTQKPEALLERIIRASSNEGDLVLDPFCGCGTTIAVAERLERRWVGVDITHLAITLMKKRLADSFGDQVRYQVIGEPTSVPDAEALAKQDPWQFQWWALGLVGARPVEQRKGADRGIDGRIYFHDEPKGGQTKQIVLSVKAGHVTAAHVRDLCHVVAREQASLGVLITMAPPTQPMRKEAAGAGFYALPWDPEKKYPKVQILTVGDLLAGKRIDCPPSHQANVTFKTAPRAKGPEAKTVAMPLEAGDTGDE